MKSSENQLLCVVAQTLNPLDNKTLLAVSYITNIIFTKIHLFFFWLITSFINSCLLSCARLSSCPPDSKTTYTATKRRNCFNSQELLQKVSHVERLYSSFMFVSQYRKLAITLSNYAIWAPVDGGRDIEKAFDGGARCTLGAGRHWTLTTPIAVHYTDPPRRRRQPGRPRHPSVRQPLPSGAEPPGQWSRATTIAVGLTALEGTAARATRRRRLTNRSLYLPQTSTYTLAMTTAAAPQLIGL